MLRGSDVRRARNGTARLHAVKALLATNSPDHLEHVESHGLGERAALPGEDLVAGLNAEAGGDVDGRVLVTLLETVVLLDVVKVILRREREREREREQRAEAR